MARRSRKVRFIEKENATLIGSVPSTPKEKMRQAIRQRARASGQRTMEVVLAKIDARHCPKQEEGRTSS